MQLWELGVVDLDAPANDYLRNFRLVPANRTCRPPQSGTSSPIPRELDTGGGCRTCSSPASARGTGPDHQVASTVAARPCRSRPCSYASCSASPLTRSVPTSRHAQRTGAESVGGTARPGVRSPTSFSRALMRAGPEVVVQDGHLMLKALSPIPSMRRGFRLYPDDPDDPGVPHLLPRVRDELPCRVRRRAYIPVGHATLDGRDVLRKAA
jgi:hypothetical protein